VRANPAARRAAEIIGIGIGIGIGELGASALTAGVGDFTRFENGAQRRLRCQTRQRGTACQEVGEKADAVSAACGATHADRWHGLRPRSIHATTQPTN
jgi:hypothetical protein